ncbi:putative transcriptional regulator TACO1, integrase-like protein [Septoria linicola]|nr:putative transcriptional regulator TACO1, integrase-like protein [Septoria linicola]
MAPSRGLSQLIRRPNLYICQTCRARGFAATSQAPSGHNRWSKIQHDKAKVDSRKNKQRSVFAAEISLASKLYGPDPQSNPRLHDLITKAKREGFAKASIEGAIARGQGRSLSGASLENVTIEGILPGNVAVIVECETDSKLRTLAEVRLAIKENGGSTTPTSYLFEKRGIVKFEKKDGVGIDEALEPALEAGATDVEEDAEGRIVVSTEPADLRAAGDAIAKALELQIATSEVVWDPNEDTKVEIPDDDAAAGLCAFLDELQDKEQTVQSIALNVSQGKLDGEAWKDLQARYVS